MRHGKVCLEIWESKQYPKQNPVPLLLLCNGPLCGDHLGGMLWMALVRHAFRP